MCIECHLKKNNTEVLSQLQYFSTLEDYTNIPFYRIQELIAASSGYNGDESRDIAIVLLDKYLELISKNSKYVFHGVLPPRVLKQKILFIKRNKCPTNDMPKLFAYLDILGSCGCTQLNI